LDIGYWIFIRRSLSAFRLAGLFIKISVVGCPRFLLVQITLNLSIVLEALYKDLNGGWDN
jgi:hypothetical protein